MEPLVIICGMAFAFLVVPVGLVLLATMIRVPEGQTNRLLVPGIIGTIGLAIGLLVIYLAASMRESAEGDWLTTNGTITDVRQSTTSSGSGPSRTQSTNWRFTYEYVVDDVRYTDTNTLGYEKYAEGGTALVYYDVDDHTRTRLTDPESASKNAGTYQKIGLGILAVSLLPLGLLAYRARGYQRRHRLTTSEAATTGAAEIEAAAGPDSDAPAPAPDP